MHSQEQALRLISVLRNDLAKTYKGAVSTSSVSLASDPLHALQALQKWKTRAIREIGTYISSSEAQYLDDSGLGNLDYAYFPNLPAEQFQRYDGFLADLAEAIKQSPSGVLAATSSNTEHKEQKLSTDSSRKSTIFIVHGHDEVNLLRLERLLVNRFELDCKILSLDPNVGRTLIEKFEEEGEKADFAFVLLTPDDQISSQGLDYKQARPNVIFELGWFYGKLGRRKVCVLKRKDTNVHSDLGGIVWIEFNEHVNEKIEEIERELVAGGLIT